MLPLLVVTILIGFCLIAAFALGIQWQEFSFKLCDLESPLYILLQKTFGIDISLRLMPGYENGKFIFYFERLHVFVRIEPKNKEQKSNPLLSLLIWILIKPVVYFGENVVLNFVAIKVKEVLVVLTPHVKDAVYTESSAIDYFKITAKSIFLCKENSRLDLLVQHCSTCNETDEILLDTRLECFDYAIGVANDLLNLLITPETLATIGAFIDNSPKEDEISSTSSGEFSFSFLNGLVVKPFQLKVKFVLSTSLPDYSYFENVQLVLKDLSIQIQEGVFIATCSEGRFVTEAREEPGERVSCKAYRMLESINRSKEHVMINAKHLVARLSFEKGAFNDFGSISWAKAKEFVDLIGTESFDYRSFLPTKDKPAGKDIATVVSVEHGRYFVIDVETKEAKFACAYEYPLTLVFDELINAIKGCFGIKPTAAHGKLIISHCYVLSVRAKKVFFTLADGSFERRLETHYCKQSMPTLPLCFEISGSDLQFIVKWDRKLVADLKEFGDLVNRIENDNFITEEHCRMLGTCIGGFSELHATELAVIVKDFCDEPLVKAPQLSIMGLLFLLEIEPYEEAYLEIPLVLKEYAANQKNTFSGVLRALKVITPIKLFHSLMGNIYAQNELVPSVNYNLHWASTFETISRAFDVFSSPPHDPSPVMSVFDKLPYIFRGSHTTLVVSGRCRVRIGFDPFGEEVLEAQLVDGLSVRLHDGFPTWIIELSSAKIVTDSRVLNPFQKVLAKEHLPLDIATLPACTAGIDFTTNEKCSHWRVKPRVKTEEDTYRDYRTQSIQLKFEFKFDPQGKVQVNYHRQVEDWLLKHTRRLCGGEVKTGKLWSSYLIPQIPPAEGFSACLKEFKLHLQIPCGLELTLVTLTDAHVLAKLNAAHGEFLFAFGRKSYQSGFQMIYSDSVYNDISVQIYSPDDEWRTFLKSDRLEYVAAAENYFAETTKATILEHLKRLQQMNVDVERVKERIRQVEKLLERVKEGKDLMTRRRFSVYRAYITWDEGMRNAIFKLVDAQIMHEMGNRAQMIPLGATERIIKEMTLQEQQRKRSADKPARIDSPHEQAQEMMRELLKEASNGPFVARKESFKKAEACRTDMRTPEKLCAELGLQAYGTTYVEINNVQIGLMTTCTAGLRKDQPEAAILCVPVIKFTTMLLHEGEHPLFRRNLIELCDAKVQVAYYKFFPNEEWPPFVQTGVNEEYFIGVTNKINVKCIYDSAWNSLEKLKIHKDGKMFELKGSRILVECPAFELQCSNEEYYMIYGLILNLLVYRDPNMASRSQKISRLVQQSDFHDGEQLLAKISSLKEDLAENNKDEIMSAEWEEKRELLYGLSEIVHSWQSLREKQEQKQSRLELLVVLRKLSWQLALRGAYVAEATIIELVDNWISEENGRMSNSLEIQSITANNIMGGAFYRTMLSPLTNAVLHRLQIDYGGEPLATANYGSQVRVFVRTSFPDVGKVCVEHAEIDVSPMFARVTQEVVEALFEFFFPPEDEEESTGNKVELTKDTTKQYFSFVVVPPSRHLISFKYRGEFSSLIDVENFLLKLPSFEYHNELLSWRELLLQVRKDALFVLMRNAGSLVVEKMKRIGQSSLREGEDPMNIFYKLEQLPADPIIAEDDPVVKNTTSSGSNNKGEKDEQARKLKLSLLFGDMLSKKK